MTLKSYQSNAYIKDFEAKIIEITEIAEGKAIALDHTYFYPEGGGQPCDYGRIEQVGIINVVIQNDRVYHITTSATQHLQVGQLVNCSIDFQRRFAFMQQHTGQHILSACAEKLFNANTVGFHIGEDYVTIDLDQKLTPEDIDALETLANDTVYANKAVHTHYPSIVELSKMPLRKMPKVTENIRVIEVDGFDFSPCGGTHTHTTAEVGIIKIKRVESYKSGIRIEFGCGYFALESFRKRNETINGLMRLFSVSDDDILTFAEQIIENQKSDRHMIEKLKEQLIKMQVAQILDSYDEDAHDEIKVITLTENQLPMADLRLKSALIAETDNCIIIATSQEEDKVHVVLSKSKNVGPELDMGYLFKSFVSPLGIKGGGNAFVAQGGTTDKIDLDALCSELEDHIREQIL